MTSLKLNTIANFAGRGWTALTSLVFIPFYIKFMGIEAYGMVGIFLSLLALFSVLDLGLSTTLNRELARMSVQAGKTQKMRDLVRTLELIYWAVALLIGIVVILLAPLIACNWVKADKLSMDTIHQAVMIMGLAIAFQWPFALYSGGLLGLQRQVLLNGIIVSVATLRGVGAVLVLWLIEPTIQAFFFWQIFVSVIQTIITAFFLWLSLPKSHTGAQFKKNLLIDIWRFAAGITGISVLSVILMQMDKIILSRILSLEMFGYYTLASVVAGGLYIFFGPIFTTLFPRFSQLVILGDQDGLKRLYHKSCQLVSVIILPVTAVVALFSAEILILWVRDPVIVDETHLLLSLLIIGNALGGLINLPYALQLAHGWTKLAFFQNLVAIIVLVPMIFWLSSYYGAEGAAFVWVLLNAGYLIIGIHFMHRKLIKEEKLRWYFEDVLKPLLSTLLVVLPAYYWFPSGMSALISLTGLILITVLTFMAAACSTCYTRHLLLSVLNIRRRFSTE